VVVSSFGSGNMPQSNSMASGILASFGIPTWATGLLLAILLGLVIVGGIRRIAVVAAAIVPFMGIFYAIGAFAVAASNYEHILPSFAAVFRDAFTGSAAAGGFLGATFAYAFNRGVNRGLFSNEAGQGSAPIAHASAKTEEPVAEGMVAILEPFIDTLLICTLTGLVILSSGVWQEKFQNQFASFDTEFVAGVYVESNPEHVAQLFAHLDLVPPREDPVRPLTATLTVVDGIARERDFTVLHNRSIAEDVRFFVGGGPYSGSLEVVEGRVTNPAVTITGKSLLHSVPLTVEAFKRSFLGDFGQYAVTLGLVMFAFSTALAWSYYGDRAVTYLIGAQAVQPYRIVYVVAFFLAAIVDTSIIWLISAVTLALMTIPNLIGLMLMRKEIKLLVDDYWRRYKDR
jgi:AGCS family alanine or glycine:cation symporter